LTTAADSGVEPEVTFFDFSDGVEFVAGVDAFWRVADEEPFVHFQAGDLFKYWHTVLFGSTGVDGGFIDDDVALFEHFAHGFACLDEWGQIGAVFFASGLGR